MSLLTGAVPSLTSLLQSHPSPPFPSPIPHLRSPVPSLTPPVFPSPIPHLPSPVPSRPASSLLQPASPKQHS
ncbi:hypothetical protein Pmani_012535 [Petrolisthes manimaculis]|uniref:Uncharacterized protein n=1 Tax=Petrolisthes manimaculis TaxID=1843537 RepID=A0AAE1PXQ8_9EUCA|nr:hypothetical protein Pmani_012535 [Petrolisthes manimaculis]